MDGGWTTTSTDRVLFRFSTKIQQLKESGLIDHWIAVEQDKVARVVKAGPATRDPVGLSVSNLQVSMEGGSPRPSNSQNTPLVQILKYLFFSKHFSLSYSDGIHLIE